MPEHAQARRAAELEAVVEQRWFAEEWDERTRSSRERDRLFRIQCQILRSIMDDNTDRSREQWARYRGVCFGFQVIRITSEASQFLLRQNQTTSNQLGDESH